MHKFAENAKKYGNGGSCRRVAPLQRPSAGASGNRLIFHRYLTSGSVGYYFHSRSTSFHFSAAILLILDITSISRVAEFLLFIYNLIQNIRIYDFLSLIVS